jgi:uncharacterized protein (DUF58 family)
MSRVALLGALGYGLLLVGLATRTGGILALALIFVIYLAAGLLFEPQPLNFQAVRTITPDRVTPGDPICIHLSITNLGAGLEKVLLEDPLPSGLSVIDGTNSALTAFPTGDVIEIKYTAQAGRGIFAFPGLKASASDYLGIFHRHTSALAPGRVQVLPQASQLKRFPIRPRHTRVYSGLIPARQGGSGVEFFGVRLYQPGDPLRRINWRATSRHPDSLFSNDYEQERVADVGLILDARLRTNVYLQPDSQASNNSLFEYQVAATAALAEALLRDGNRVGLLVYGAFLDWTYPGYGKTQRERIFQTLSRARVGESSVFSNLQYLPRRVFPTRSQIILISPLVVEDLPILIRLRANGFQVMVVSADPVAYEKTAPITKQSPNELAFRLAALERSILISNLTHAGVQVLDWNVSIPFDQAVKQAEMHLSRAQVIIRGLP